MRRPIVLIAVIALLSACSMIQPGRRADIPFSGSWTNSSGMVWVINTDGTYDVDMDGDGHRDSWGTIRVQGEEVSIRGTGGLRAGGCKQPGVYRYEMNADTIRFTLVNDRCKMRKRYLAGEWHRK